MISTSTSNQASLLEYQTIILLLFAVILLTNSLALLLSAIVLVLVSLALLTSSSIHVDAHQHIPHRPPDRDQEVCSLRDRWGLGKTPKAVQQTLERRPALCGVDVHAIAVAAQSERHDHLH